MHKLCVHAYTNKMLMVNAIESIGNAFFVFCFVYSSHFVLSLMVMFLLESRSSRRHEYGSQPNTMDLNYEKRLRTVSCEGEGRRVSTSVRCCRRFKLNVNENG